MDNNPIVYEFSSNQPLERRLHYVRVRSDGSYSLAEDRESEPLHSSPANPFSIEIAKLAQEVRRANGEP